MTHPGDIADALVVGGGVVGCAVARRLTLDGLGVTLVERAPDVLDGASKGNSAILHTGFDAPVGSLEATLIARGRAEYLEIHERLGLPLDRCGALVLAWSEDETARLPALMAQAAANGVAVEPLERAAILALEPELAAGVRAGFRVPGEAIVDAWSAPHAYLRQAVANGAKVERERAVTGARREGGVWHLETMRGPLAGRIVVNAAGLHGDRLDAMLLGEAGFTIRPRKGQFVVFDKPAARLARHILLPVPTDTTKGVVVCRTAYGNLLVGPTAEEQEARDRADLTEDALRALRRRGAEILPALAHEDVTAIYAGLRPATERKEYRVALHEEARVVTLGGIRSTGLSAALGLAAHLAPACAAWLDAAPVPPPDPHWPAMPNIAEARARLAAARQRRHRVPLRDGDAARDRGGARRSPAAAPLPRGAQAPHPRHAGPLPGLLLPGRAGPHDRGPPRAPHRRACGVSLPAEAEAAEVVVIGAGPAGLAAAMALREAGRSVLVLDREAEPGGIPRHCDHPPYGLREFGRLMKGPAYARRLVERARRVGVSIAAGVTVAALEPGARLTVTSDAGLAVLTPRRAILCTGARETSRAARLIGGVKPGGVISTGALQGLVHLHRRRPFRAPVVLGTELVSFSALLTCRRLGIRPVAMVEPGPEAVARWPAAWLPWIMGVPLLLNTRVTGIEGAERVAAVLIDGPDGSRRLEADGVIVTGGFRPEAALSRAGHLALDPGTGGPAVDQFARTSDPAIFAAGNVLRPVETAGWSHAEGRRVGRAVARDLAHGLPEGPGEAVRLDGGGLRFVVPQRIVAGDEEPALPVLQMRAALILRGRLIVRRGDRTVLSRRLSTRPERRITVPLGRLPDGEGPLTVSVEGCAAEPAGAPARDGT